MVLSSPLKQNRARGRPLVLALLWLAFFAGHAAAQILVVVPAKSKIDSVTSKDLQKLFKGQAASHFPPASFQIVEFAPSNDAFYGRLYNLSAYVMGKHWLRVIFAGERVLPPKSFSEAAQFFKFFAEHDNALGFLPAELLPQAPPGTLRALVVEGRDYSHAEYFFREKQKPY
jgi:hypothetical protein